MIVIKDFWKTDHQYICRLTEAQNVELGRHIFVCAELT